MIRLAIVALLTATTAAQSVVVDRVVAIVNETSVITLSEWDLQSRYEALVGGTQRVLPTLDPAALDRLIDVTLVRARLASLGAEDVTEAEVSEHLQTLRRQRQVAGDVEWRALLHNARLTEAEVRSAAAEQLALWKLIERRFRPGVQVSTEEVRDYYEREYLPQMRSRGVTEKDLPTMDAVEDQITRILSEQRINEVFQSWLKTLRSQAKVRKLVK